MSDALQERGRALEDLFFAEQDRQRIAALRAKLDRETAAAELARVTGVTDTALLDQLAGIGVQSDTLTAFGLVPLLHVAWADKVLDEAERAAILIEAAALGVEPGSAGATLLQSWLSSSPKPELFAAWAAFHQALAPHLSEDQRAAVKASLLERAGRIARASGGVMGVFAESPEESKALAAFRALLG